MTREGKVLLSLLLAFLLSFLPAICWAEEMYQMSAGEMTQLKSNLDELRNINDRQSRESALLQEQLLKSQMQLGQAEELSQMLKMRLKESQAQLGQAEGQSVRLQTQLQDLTTVLQGQAQSLQNANRLLAQFKKEEQARLRRSKRERTIAYIVAAAGLCFALRKL